MKTAFRLDDDDYALGAIVVAAIAVICLSLFTSVGAAATPLPQDVVHGAETAATIGSPPRQTAR